MARHERQMMAIYATGGMIVAAMIQLTPATAWYSEDKPGQGGAS